MAYSEELGLCKTFPALDARQLTPYETVKLRPSNLSMGGATFHVPNHSCSLELLSSDVIGLTICPQLKMFMSSSYTRLPMKCGNITGLLDLACKTVADMLIGKTWEAMRTHFNIKNDYTSEEEAEVRKENA
ncbi:hypothetical protein HID58_034117 [Brassica napus]|uniref:SKP1 component dimerisation domain-containing protein n=1 Tax=Brassica napus TaxID=3708 RepID=A0ABQ8C154_BRANA|nr:hypothetical protein HID58_034117 [Brassica napus]